jgi:hypothetical protein
MSDDKIKPVNLRSILGDDAPTGTRGRQKGSVNPATVAAVKMLEAKVGAGHTLVIPASKNQQGDAFVKSDKVTATSKVKGVKSVTVPIHSSLVKTAAQHFAKSTGRAFSVVDGAVLIAAK